MIGLLFIFIIILIILITIYMRIYVSIMLELMYFLNRMISKWLDTTALIRIMTLIVIFFMILMEKVMISLSI